jgi:hypothetical protein
MVIYTTEKPTLTMEEDHDNLHDKEKQAILFII